MEAGVRGGQRNAWRRYDYEDTALLPPDPYGYHPSTNPNGVGMGHCRVPSPNPRLGPCKLHSPQAAIIPEGIPGRPLSKGPPGYYPQAVNNLRLNEPRRSKDKPYRELDEQERYPGLDKDTARLVLHSSNLNLSQHIYSEPSFENPKQPPKPKKFSLAFWK